MQFTLTYTKTESYFNTFPTLDRAEHYAEVLKNDCDINYTAIYVQED